MTTPSAMTLNSDSLPVLKSGNIESYISAVCSVPNLEREEEVRLSKNLLEHGCLESARKLVVAHLKCVVFIAKGFKNYKMPQDELIQEGNIGLMKAVKRFSPDKGVRLVTFAHHWIYAEIADYVVRNFRGVKIATTKAQRKLFFNLRKLKKSVSWMSDTEVASMATELNVPEYEVRQMENRLTSKDVSFSSFTSDDDDDDGLIAPEDYLSTDAFSGESYMEALDEADYKGMLYQAIDGLDERSRDVIHSRWLNEDRKSTLHDLSKKYGVSAERIRQLEVIALKKLKHEMADAQLN